MHRMMTHSKAHCKAGDFGGGRQPSAAGRAVAIAAAGGAVPEWVHLLPAGPDIVGRDGRVWRMPDAAAVVRATLSAEPSPVLHIDYEHASETRAPAGEPAPAAGWIEELEARADGIWARVEWTERAAQMIAAREYRFLSPVFYFDPESGEILSLVSAALTNRPNLPLAALNRGTAPQRMENAMDLKGICKALGLNAEASAEAIEAAINDMMSRIDNPSLEKFVPRADYDAMKQRAENAEQALKDERAAKIEAEITAIIDEAVEAGKIAPATKDYYAAQCRTEGGLERFKEFVAAAPKLSIATDSGLDNKQPGKGASTLTEEEKAVCRNLGLSEEDYLKSKATA